MTRPTALIFGITGQDGQALAQFLLPKDYHVIGVSRRVSSEEETLKASIGGAKGHLDLISGDLLDVVAIGNLIDETKPDEIYNLAAQSDVAESLYRPLETLRANTEAAAGLLEVLRNQDKERSIRLYQASTSQMFDPTENAPYTEESGFSPQTPYGLSKEFAHKMCVYYREHHGLQVSCGIMFNHEGPNRGENFVSRKISKAAARIKAGSDEPLILGNLSAVRDWGHVRDYVEAMWLMLQNPPDDFVLATGKARQVRDFATAAFRAAGFELKWQDEGLKEQGLDARTGRVLVSVSPDFYREESGNPIGDAGKAKRLLGWEPKVSFDEMVTEMVKTDIARLN